MAEFARRSLELQKLAVLYINNDYGGGLRDIFSKQFASLGGTVICTESFDQGSTDMRTQLAKIRDTAPQRIYRIGY